MNSMLDDIQSYNQSNIYEIYDSENYNESLYKYEKLREKTIKVTKDGYLDNSDLLSITEHLLETDLSHIVGDSNLDGNLDVADVITYINAILSPQDITEEMYEYMDLNEDGIINAVDVIILINALLGN